MDWDSFFTVHQDLPREGPGAPEDVAWVCELAGVAADAMVCDAGSGPGGDVAALLQAVPQGRVVAVDKYFGDAADARFADEPRARGISADFSDLEALPEAPFDLIWCAGALYFLGLDEGPKVMAKALKPGGVLAFSEPCFFVDNPSPEAVAFWEDYPTQSEPAIRSAVEAAGFEILGTRRVSDAGWEAYFQPMEARIAVLRPEADAKLTAMLDLCADEAAAWRAIKDQTGYLLVVARKSA
ncbi:MAG: methyltransferase domain-containing protein [Paracoccaceae bacterium]|nr:methyltransferase domain-containing protein [Paracoccaceae bacterium]